MKRVRIGTVLACAGGSCIAGSDGLASPGAEQVSRPTNAVELLPLQGRWEGFAVGAPSQQRITITIAGDTLHFHRDTNFWFETTIRIPAGRIPLELRATIRNSAPPTNVIGEVVQAIFKVEGEKLILATGGDGDGGPPKSFDASADTGMTRYELTKSRLPSDSVAAPDGR